MNSSSEKSFTLKRKLDDSDGESTPGSVSPWEFKRLRADLIQSKTLVTRLEDRIDQLHKNNKEAVILFDKENCEMKSQLESHRNEVKELKHRLHRVKAREAEYKRDLAENVATFEKFKLSQQGRILDLESENEMMFTKLCALESGSADNNKLLKEELRKVKEEAMSLWLQVDEEKELRDSLEARLAVALQDAKDAAEVAQCLADTRAKVKELERRQTEYEDAMKATCSLRDRVLRLEEVEKELTAKKQKVAELQMAVENKVMLEERVHDLETKLAAVADSEMYLIDLRSRVESMGNEIERWRSIALDFCSDVSSVALRDYIEGLQRKELTSALETNQLKATISSLETRGSSLKEEVDSLRSGSEETKSMLSRAKLENQLIRKKAMLLTRERDCYREQLDSFEKDLTLIGVNPETVEGSGKQGDVSEYKERLKQMEGTLDKYRALVDQLETQLNLAPHHGSVDHVEELGKLRVQIQSLEDLNSKLSKRKDELEIQLEERVAAGDYLNSGTKVLHMKMNPVSEARQHMAQEMTALQKECETLRARVKLLEEGEQLDITRKAVECVESSSNQRIKELEKEISSIRLKSQRLKEFFTKTGQNFRNVSYMLLGYRIDLVNSKYRLTNVYSEDPEDYFMFQQHGEEGKLEMLETPFAQSLSSLVNKHLHERNSIPAFLSAVTLALHNASLDNDDNDDEEPDPEEEVEEEQDDEEEEKEADEDREMDTNEYDEANEEEEEEIENEEEIEQEKANVKGRDDMYYDEDDEENDGEEYVEKDDYDEDDDDDEEEDEEGDDVVEIS